MINARVKWFAAFTAIFAVCAAIVFWGTWALDVVPIMPDATSTFPTDSASRAFKGFLASGCFVPWGFFDLLGIPYFFAELHYVISVYCAALAIVYLLRGRGLERPAAYGAGLLLAFSGYWLSLFSAGHLGWFKWMLYGPFAFGLIDRALTKDKLRHWLLLGAVVAWAGFQQQDLWLLFTVFTAAYFVYRSIVERKFAWKGILISAAVFALIGLPNVKSTIEGALAGRIKQIKKGENIVANSKEGASDADKRWEFVTNWSMPPADTLEFVNSRVHGDTSCPLVLSINGPTKGVTPYVGALGRPMNATRGNYRQHSLYVGWVTCLLALAGLVFAFRKYGAAHRRDILFFAVSALLFYLLSLGRYFEPTYRVIFALPFGDLIRCPVKWHHLTEFCLAILAGYGIMHCWLLVGRLGKAGKIAVIALVLIGAFDLAHNASLYCAPVNVSVARRTGQHSQISIMHASEFRNPNVAAAVRAGKIVSVARFYANPDAYLVQVLDKFGLDTSKPAPLPMAMGIVSLLVTLGVIAYGVKKS